MVDYITGGVELLSTIGLFFAVISYSKMFLPVTLTGIAK